MNVTKRFLLTLVTIAALVVPAAVWAGEEKVPEMPSAEEMAAAMAMMSPGEHHQHIAKMVGKWKTRAKMWMQPGAEPMESEGVSETVSLMDGRYFQTHYEGTFMGMPFKGMGLDGYDNMKKKHVGTWIDTMSTMIMTYEGTCSDDHKVVTTYSEMPDPMSGQQVKLRNVTTMVDDDHFTYESYATSPAGEGEMKVMEIAYERM